MSRTFAVISNGSVVNVVVAAAGWTTPEGDAVEIPAGAGVGIGWSWDGDVFVPPAAAPVTWDEVRERRDGLLGASDWTQVADAPVDQQAWAVYRQALRDIPQDFASPDAVVWPEAP